MTAMLEVENVSKAFGGVQANHAISLTVPEGEIVGLIGPNGSGKTTLFSSIVGYHPIDTGSIRFEGREISTLRVRDIARLGLLRTFQQTRIYGQMTCMQNMVISASVRKRGFGELFHGQHDPHVSKYAEEMLEFVGLYEKRLLRAGSLSFGQQKLLEFAMALMNEPKLLMLDEPTAGINPTPQARQRAVRHHAVRDRAQHARDHESGPAHLLPGAWRIAGVRYARQDPQRSKRDRRLSGGALT